MARALRLAARGRYRTAPNPMVGALVLRDGEVVGEGYHRRAGAPHAEVEALRQAGERAAGATVYVTLEPCAHVGRTPPCVEALVGAGVARVVAAHRDPDPRVAGRGFERLRAAGIEVESGVALERAVRLNFRYLAPFLLRRPAVTLKWAMSLDGRIATAGGESQWISGEAGRRWALELREEHDAVLVGSGTVLADDPRLDRRLGRAPGQNLRVILDRRLRLPATARLFDGGGPVRVYTESPSAEGRRALEARGARVVVLPRVTPASVLEDLWEAGERSVLVEGGAGVLGAFFDCGAFDRVAVLCAPVLIGGAEAPGPLGGLGVGRLGEAPRLEAVTRRRRGTDLVVHGYREGCLRALSRSVGG